MTTFTIEYRSDIHDDWDFSVLNEDPPYYTAFHAVESLFKNAKKLVERFKNVPHNDYRIVDDQGESILFYSANEFKQLLEHFIAKSVDQFEIET